jgi:hypothetical protein
MLVSFVNSPNSTGCVFAPGVPESREEMVVSSDILPVISKNVGTDGKSTEAVQWDLRIAAFVGALDVVFCFMPLPEISDAMIDK